VAEPLKHFFSRSLVADLARALAAADAAFPARTFVRRACAGLEDLELMDRGRHIARVLADHLPDDYPRAIDLLLRSLGPEHASDELLGAGMAPFFYLPHTLFVAQHGLDHFDLSMRAQVELTKRFSAEVSVRPYIARDPERAWRFFGRWAKDANPHVRRLVSEGTRLRLPWAPRVAWLDEHPERVLELLERLKDDRASLVRRSVANNLNDLGKVHPDLLARTARAWLNGASAERRALIEHALRSAVKRAEPAALGILGYGRNAAVAIDAASFSPARVAIGGQVTIRFTVRSTSARRQDLLIDLAVHFVKASAKPAAKVFKLRRVDLAPGAEITLQKKISLAVHTTRVPRPGRHAVEVLINGVAFPVGAFRVVA
jgi:3-methyladenine DNA glycosylase AlkC